MLILFLQDRFEKVKFLVEVCRYILILSIKIKISRGITLTFFFFYTYFFEGLPFYWVQSDISLLKTLICISLIVSLKNNTYIHIYMSWVRDFDYGNLFPSIVGVGASSKISSIIPDSWHLSPCVNFSLCALDLVIS